MAASIGASLSSPENVSGVARPMPVTAPEVLAEVAAPVLAAAVPAAEVLAAMLEALVATELVLAADMVAAAAEVLAALLDDTEAAADVVAAGLLAAALVAAVVGAAEEAVLAGAALEAEPVVAVLVPWAQAATTVPAAAIAERRRKRARLSGSCILTFVFQSFQSTSGVPILVRRLGPPLSVGAATRRPRGRARLHARDGRRSVVLHRS